MEKVLKEVKPVIQSHGGDVQLVGVKGDQIKIKIKGACVGCPMAQATFGKGLREMIKEKVPAVKKIEFIT